MVVQPEARRAFRRRVAARAFEYAAAVMDHMRPDVDRRILPLDQLPVHPDLSSARERHNVSSTTILASGNWVIWELGNRRHGRLQSMAKLVSNDQITRLLND